MSLSAKILPLTAALAATIAISGCNKQEPTDTETQTTAATTNENTATTSEATDTDPLNTEPSDTATSAEVAADTVADLDEPNAATNTSTSDENKDTGLTTATDNKAQQSLMTNPVAAGSPEATLKAALDTLYYGDAKKAARYYQVDMENFSEELAKTQFAFQQTVEGVTVTNTTYNADKTKATIEGELMLKDQQDPAPLTYELQKIDGQWKILG
ncbi:hypothetical protein [Psychrobacter pygoscelis]|uniref:hypothetical protein n=1 Tax=Psychrobacter pygoscelis TaxID=2488563 RepID=UPI00103E12D6|nr:hypothetical protein [Psychrobacter pygoscelis]